LQQPKFKCMIAVCSVIFTYLLYCLKVLLAKEQTKTDSFFTPPHLLTLFNDNFYHILPFRQVKVAFMYLFHCSKQVGVKILCKQFNSCSLLGFAARLCPTDKSASSIGSPRIPASCITPRKLSGLQSATFNILIKKLSL